MKFIQTKPSFSGNKLLLLPKKVVFLHSKKNVR